MNDYLSLLLWVAVIGVLFGVAWRMGYLERLSQYVLSTREELRKCTWPSVEELKASTVLVILTILLLGAFTALVDVVVVSFVRFII
jgi:preprotein translocase SecE subunit